MRSRGRVVTWHRLTVVAALVLPPLEYVEAKHLLGLAHATEVLRCSQTRARAQPRTHRKQDSKATCDTCVSPRVVPEMMSTERTGSTVIPHTAVGAQLTFPISKMPIVAHFHDAPNGPEVAQEPTHRSSPRPPRAGAARRPRGGPRATCPAPARLPGTPGKEAREASHDQRANCCRGVVQRVIAAHFWATSLPRHLRCTGRAATGDNPRAL